MTRAQLKALAKAQMEGNIGMMFVIYLVGGLITAAPAVLGGILGIIPGLSIIGSIVAGICAFLAAVVVQLSIYRIYLNITNGIRPKVEDFKFGFGNMKSGAILYLLTELYVFLWMLLFIIPGIIKAISYSMAPYILAEHPDMRPSDAIKESKIITQGRKWDIVVLSLSFFGWILLSYVTCGLMLIYVMPYAQTTFANYYNSIKRNISIRDEDSVAGAYETTTFEPPLLHTEEVIATEEDTYEDIITDTESIDDN